VSENKTLTPKVTWVGYVALIVAIMIFSGAFANQQGWLRVFDFTVLNGAFGRITTQGTPASFTFRGAGGSGARDGFMFALELMPAVILALGLIGLVEGLGGLAAGQKLLTPLLKPLMGIPGMCGLALIGSLQSTDAGAGMTKELFEHRQVTDDERTVFGMFQFSAAATITNYFSSGVALFGFLLVPISVPLIVILVFKVFGANLMRLYLRMAQKQSVPGVPPQSK